MGLGKESEREESARKGREEKRTEEKLQPAPTGNY